ncbi:hypothetical protein BpHYR1_010873 [Brachionus plicatilis]|uniref:Uncharacterized protein n=1 Tax=Brachionus plicatilis TaxID=10195 RepID=A0A3M7QN57_BRAPC|nr:hypothetical protein BpHYR1_010873 [Brachionus plicatilis]
MIILFHKSANNKKYLKFYTDFNLKGLRPKVNSAFCKKLKPKNLKIARKKSNKMADYRPVKKG